MGRGFGFGNMAGQGVALVPDTTESLQNYLDWLERETAAVRSQLETNPDTTTDS